MSSPGGLDKAVSTEMLVRVVEPATEDVMAEAILFGHRSLLPLVELQEELQRQVGKPKRLPYIEPSTESVLEFLDATAAGRALVVFDTETTSRDVKLGEVVEIGALKVVNGTVTDRWSTLVRPSRSMSTCRSTCSPRPRPSPR